MRSGMQLLLELLRGQARTTDVSETEWMEVLSLAEQESVLPWAAACLRRAVADPTPGLAERLRQIDRSAQIATFWWASVLKSTLADFHRRGIPVICLKGPWLAERLYGDAALRSCRDLDLLVHRSDISAAEGLLDDVGFVPRERRDDYHRAWHRNGIVIELHHNVENPLAFDFAVEAAWNRSQLSQFRGIPARLLAPEDELLFLCLHGTRHRFERLRHILDLQFAFGRLPLPRRLGQRRDSEFENVVALAAMLLSRMNPEIPVAQEIDGRLGRNRERLQGIADEIWQERMNGAAAELNWETQHRFYLEIENPGGRRILRRARHGWILVTRLIETDFAFAERFNLRRKWQVWLLRPIRLLLKHAVFAPRHGRGAEGETVCATSQN